jgi:hypothetical protein
MKIADALRELNTRPLIDLWPTTAAVLGVSRSEVYALAARGEIEVLPIGRLKKALTGPLRRKTRRSIRPLAESGAQDARARRRFCRQARRAR